MLGPAIGSMLYGEDTKNDSEMDTESDIKDDSEDNEEERGITRVENCQTKNIKIIENKFEVCKDRNKCDNETVGRAHAIPV